MTKHNDRGGKAEPVRSPVVFAGPCPRSDNHKNTRVYKTDGRIRRCVCDDCGETWKRTGPRAGEAEGGESEKPE